MMQPYPLSGSIVANAFDELATRHDKGLLQENLLQTSLYHAATWFAIQQVISSQQTNYILDVGGGNGIWSIRLAKLGYQVAYVDLSQRMAQVARINANTQKAKLLITQGDAHNLNFLPARYFDLVLAVGDLICYSDNPVKICQQLFNRCKPSGKMIISVMGRYGILPHLLETTTINEITDYLNDGLWVEFEQQELGQNVKSPLMARTFTTSELSNLCQSSGWVVDGFFSAGILRTLLGRSSLDAFIEAEGMKTILSLEQQLSQIPALLDCAIEFGLAATKPALNV